MFFFGCHSMVWTLSILDKDGKPYNGYFQLEDERDWACYDEKLSVAGVKYPNSYKKLKLEKLHDYFLILRECYIDVIHSYHLQWIGLIGFITIIP
jgi:hypothetical protein